MTKVFIKVVLILYSITSNVYSQTLFFNNGDEKSSVLYNNSNKKTLPDKYRTVFFNASALKSFLWSLPTEQSLVNRKQAPIINLPMPDGSTAKFYVWESTIMEQGLADRFPDIKTFAGQGIDDPYATVRFDYNPSFGFSAQILSAHGDVYIDPYTKDNIHYNISYYSKEFKKNVPFSCQVIGQKIYSKDSTTSDRGFCRGSELYTFRLAVACTGEYAIAVCTPNQPSVAATMAAVTTTINRVNGIYEKELAIRFLLVANSSQLIFLNPAADPYTNGNPDVMMNENQLLIDNTIGSANYDIGHVFGTGNSSRTTFFTLCNTTSKAKVVSGFQNPLGDLFDVNQVAHTLGHVFGASDNYNSNNTACLPDASVAFGMEPGSGTTIMSAAGTCGTDNIQPQNDAFFHSWSYNSITEFLSSTWSGCKGIITTGNTPPRILSMPGNGSYIPINTPFTLNATATDDNGDAITYCWEQVDRGAGGAWNSGATTLLDPLFKSRIPKTTGSRTFPDMAVILAGYPVNPSPVQDGLKGETLPVITRTIKFGLTIRDNRAGGGGVINDDNDCSTTLFPFEIYATANTGPFIVNLPDGGETWSALSSQTILWNVANTNAPPVNTTFVNILLSTDGGITFPFFLATNVPNDGFEIVTMPNISTATARIKIEAVGNIFFDISNANFSIAQAPVGFELSTPAAMTLSCPAPSSVTYSLGAISNGGYNSPVILSASSIPAGATIVFGTNPVQPGSSSNITINNVNELAQGIYYITVTGTSGSITRTRILVLNIQTGASPVITSQPVSQSDCEGSNITFSIQSPSAIYYQWQKSTDGGFTFANITVNGNAASYTILNAGDEFNNRYRCLVGGQCNITTSNVVRAYIIPRPTITSQPQNTEVCEGGSKTFSLAAQGGSLTYQWQVNRNDGAGFVNINGANQTSLNLVNVTFTMSNNQYRCLVLPQQCITPTASSIASLTVNLLPSVSIISFPYSKLLPGLITTITASGIAAPGSLPVTFRWKLGNAILGGVNGTTYDVSIARLGDYQVEIIDAKGCVGQSPVLNIGDSAINKLFILSNPNSGQFAVTYYNSGNTPVERKLVLYSACGAKIFSDETIVSGAYQLMHYDISKVAKGMYFLLLLDKSNKVLAKEKMLVQ